MKFEYIGDEPKITLRGVTFKKGAQVEVANEALSQKIKALNYFVEVDTASEPELAGANDENKV